MQTQGRNIRHYSVYLIKRAEAYSKARCDYVFEGSGRLAKLSIDKGLLHETEAVQTQLMALLKCDVRAVYRPGLSVAHAWTVHDRRDGERNKYNCVQTDSHGPATSLYSNERRHHERFRSAFHRLISSPLLTSTEHYFEMSRPDAERALEIYKNFTRITDQVIKFLNIARQFEHVTKVDTPKLKHAPTSLTSALEEYLHAPDFESNRRQYLGQQDGKQSGKAAKGPSRSATFEAAKPISSNNGPARSATIGGSSTTAKPVKATGPSPDLIDFFDSIEQNQQPMATQSSNNRQQSAFTGGAPQYQAPSAFAPQQTGFDQQTVFAPQQTGFVGMQHGFGQQHNGFDQSNMQHTGSFMSQQTGTNPFGAPVQQQQSQQTGNPFDTFTTQQQPQQTGNPFGNFQHQQVSQPHQPQQQPQQLQPQFTGAGFGGYTPQPSDPQTLMTMNQFSQQLQQPQQNQQPQFTGGLQRQATNPFRQSMLPNTTGSNPSPFGQNTTGGSPFGMNTAIPEESAMQSFSPQSYSSPQSNSPFAPQQNQSQPAELQAQRTGTNPFARQQQNSSPAALQPQATGTNPFRQSAFVIQNTGQGWQQSGQGTFGGFDTQAIDTTPVFPRPTGQQLGYGQQPQGFI